MIDEEKRKQVRAAADLELPDLRQSDLETPKPPVDSSPDKAAPETQAAERPDMILPRCPQCGADPLLVQFRQFDMPQPDGSTHIFSVFFCGNRECRKTLNVQMVGVKPPQVMPAGAFPHAGGRIRMS